MLRLQKVTSVSVERLFSVGGNILDENEKRRKLIAKNVSSLKQRSHEEIKI